MKRRTLIWTLIRLFHMNDHFCKIRNIEKYATVFHFCFVFKYLTEIQLLTTQFHDKRNV
jgi:hypothetical protein